MRMTKENSNKRKRIVKSSGIKERMQVVMKVFQNDFMEKAIRTLIERSKSRMIRSTALKTV